VQDDGQANALLSKVFHSGNSKQPISLHMFATPFRMRVWEALLRIPYGALCSYQQIASAIGQPQATRAVASAVARNPVAYLVPCHRVIKSNGVIHQYRWGKVRKHAMIGWEQAKNALHV
ncbi:MAG: cysteine methyltransferase, partial [Phototrophicales bacterium]